MSIQHTAVLGEVGLRGWCPVCGPGLPSRNPTKEKAYPGNTQVGNWVVSGSGGCGQVTGKHGVRVTVFSSSYPLREHEYLES